MSSSAWTFTDRIYTTEIISPNILSIIASGVNISGNLQISSNTILAYDIDTPNICGTLNIGINNACDINMGSSNTNISLRGIVSLTEPTLTLNQGGNILSAGNGGIFLHPYGYMKVDPTASFFTLKAPNSNTIINLDQSLSIYDSPTFVDLTVDTLNIDRYNLSVLDNNLNISYNSLPLLTIRGNVDPSSESVFVAPSIVERDMSGNVKLVVIDTEGNIGSMYMGSLPPCPNVGQILVGGPNCTYEAVTPMGNRGISVSSSSEFVVETSDYIPIEAVGTNYTANGISPQSITTDSWTRVSNVYLTGNGIIYTLSTIPGGVYQVCMNTVAVSTSGGFISMHRSWTVVNTGNISISSYPLMDERTFAGSLSSGDIVPVSSIPYVHFFGRTGTLTSSHWVSRIDVTRVI